MFTYILMALGVPTLIWLISYFIPMFLLYFVKPQNLKKKYNAEWALVTGGSSGIGRAIVDRLALQGFNIVIVALEDDLLDQTIDTLTRRFPNQEFIKVGGNFSPNVDYMTPILEATEKLNIQVIFNNAGYIVTDFFDQSKVDRQLNNLECNLVAAVKITHHFLEKLVQNKRKGCIVFTSSVAGYIPSPFSSMYGATKSFLSQFAACLAIEAKSCGIDVCAIHPSPVASNFYQNTRDMEMLDMAKKSAVSPDVLPDEIFRSIGKVPLRDIGSFAVITRVCTSMLPYNMITWAFGTFAPLMADFKKYNKGRTD